MLADLRPRANVAAVVGMVLMGSLGLAVIAQGTPVTFLIGALMLVKGLWGWNGLLVTAAIRLLPGSSARALGSLQVGFFSGATVAPFLFGAVSAAASFWVALLVVAASAVVAPGVVAAGEIYRRREESGAVKRP